MRNSTRMFAVLLVAQSAPALAGVDIQVMGGARTAKADYEVGDEEKTMDVKSTEFAFALHVSPSKVLPVAFGVFGAMNKYDMSAIFEEQIEAATDAGMDGGFNFDDPKASLTGTTYGPEVMAWVPIPFFKPFLRASYAMGTYEFKRTVDYDVNGLDGELSESIKYKSSGYGIGFGFNYSPVPLLGLIVEYNLGQDQLEATSAKQTNSATSGGVTISSEEDVEIDDLADDEKKRDVASGAVRLGLSLSF